MVETAGRITLWGIEVFAATADEGSISAAARRLGASPSAISQQLTGLEAAVGTVLIDRSARPLALTRAGELFRRRAQTILNEAEQARAEMSMRGMAQVTRFRLGMIEDFEADVTPALLASLAREMPRSQFLLETGASHRLYDQLDARAVDMVVATEIGRPPAWAEVIPLMEEPFVAAVPRGAVPEGRDAAEVLAALPLILYTARHLMGRQIADHLARQGLRLSHRFELDSYLAILAMVATGAGWTILTPLGLLRAQRFLDRVDLMPLPFGDISRRISLMTRAGPMDEMPAEVATRLRPLIDEMIVRPARERMPWLDERLRVL